MLKVTTPLVVLLAPFACCFNEPVHETFSVMVMAWVVCLGRRTISRVWQTTGQAGDRDHSKAYRLFNQAVWNFDDLGRIMLIEFLCDLIPGSSVWLVVDDTLCHKRGAKVAFGGIFLDAVLSSRKHKTLRFGVNWVTLGVVVQLPFRKDRCFCVNLLWRVYSKQTKGLPHQTKSQLAKEMVKLVATWLPDFTLFVVADSAYIGKYLLKDLPRNVVVIGPIHKRAALSLPLPADAPPKRKKGDPFPAPVELLHDVPFGWDDLELEHPKGKKNLQVQVFKDLRWYDSAGTQALQVVVVHDPDGQWRDEMLLCTSLDLPPQDVILGYMKRWSVEVCYWESKELLGLHDPQVWNELAVQRAHPMAWFVGGLVLVWYAKYGQAEEQAHWDRPWYTHKHKIGITFADMLATMRLHLWRHAWQEATPEEQNDMRDWLFHYISTAMG